MDCIRFYVHYEGDPEFTTKLTMIDHATTVQQIIQQFTDNFNEKFGETKTLDPRRIQLKLGEKKLLKPTDRISLINEGDDLYASDFMPLDVPFECGRNGCGKTYTEAENTDVACHFHSGSILFHEGSKGWNCCTKRVLDFDEALALPGCTMGRHTPKEKTIQKKPVVQKQVQDMAVTTDGAKEVYVDTRSYAPAKKAEKPKPTPPPLPVEQPDPADAVIPKGAPCIHRGCNYVFIDDSSRTAECVYHPLDPVFHDGSQGWGCCKKKALEFDDFLKIEGCTTGVHKFIKPPDPIRHDFYQTPVWVIVTFYSKGVKRDPAQSSIRFESKKFHVKFTLADGRVYEESLNLGKEIDPAASRYEILSTKVEVKLKKASAEEWDAFNLQG